MNNEEVRRETFKSVYGVETLKEIVEQFKKEYSEVKNDKEGFDKISNLFQKYVLSITLLYSVSTIKGNLKLYRNAITKEGGIWKDTVKSSFYIYDVYKVVTTNTDNKMKEREQSNKESELNVKKEIENLKDILYCRSYRVSNNQTEEQVRSYYLAYIIGLSTGRRFTEILKTVSFRKKGKKYIFNGILKKDKDQKEEIEANFLYLTADEIREYLKELRAYLNSKLTSTKGKTLEEVTEEEMNSLFSKVYNNAIKRISEGVIPNFHELRHHYTIEGTKEFQRAGETDRDTRYRILGHHIKEDSTRTYATTK